MRKFFSSLLCPLIAIAAVLGTANQADAQVWSLADDFSYTENSDTSTWSYRLDNNAGNYPLLTTNTRNALELWGTAFPDPPLMWSDAEGYWGVGKNLSGVTQSAGTTDWAPDEILFHPQGALPGRMAFSWLSPVDMTVDANYTFGSAMPVGNGIGYRIVHSSGGVDTTVIDFSASTYVGMGSLSGSKVVTVAAGDRLNFSFDNWGNAGGDITRAAITIEEYVPPEPYELPFLEDFDGFTAPAGNFNNQQPDTGLVVAHTGDVPGWGKEGGGAVHVVDRANIYPSDENPRDFAPMFWQDNIITLATPIVANTAGETYFVEFLGSPAVYGLGGEVQATTVDDGVLIEVLRADDTVLDSYTYMPGAWAGDTTFTADSFTYVGDGTGDVRLRVGPSNFNSGQFGGAIDNLSVEVASEDLILVWNGNGPGSWDSANWELPDGTPTAAVPSLERFITVTTNVVTVDGLGDAEARSLDVINNGGIAIAEGKTLTVAKTVDFEAGTTLSLGNNATLAVGDGGVLRQVTTAGNATIDTGGPVELEALNAGGGTGVFAKQGDGELSLLSASNTLDTTFETRAGTLGMVGEPAWGESTRATLAGGVLLIEDGAGAPNLTGKHLTVTAGSTLSLGTTGPVTFGGLTMAEGTLTTSGMPVSFAGGTTIDPAEGVTAIGINAQTATELGPVNGTGATVDVVKTGDGMLTLSGEGTGLDSTAFVAAEGQLVAYHGANPFGGATLKLAGGELLLSAKLAAASQVDYDNAVVVEADATISAGPGDAGHAGPMVVNLGSAAKAMALNTHTVELKPETGYELNVAGTVSGSGGLVVNQGTVTLSGASSSVGSLEVAGATVSTAGNDLTISDHLKVGELTYSITGATFAARSTDLSAGADLTLGAGVLTITGGFGPSTPISLNNADFEASGNGVPPTDWTVLQGASETAEHAQDNSGSRSAVLPPVDNSQISQTSTHVIVDADAYQVDFRAAVTAGAVGPNALLEAVFYADDGAGTLTEIGTVGVNPSGSSAKTWDGGPSGDGWFTTGVAVPQAAEYLGQNLAVSFRNGGAVHTGVDDVSLGLLSATASVDAETTNLLVTADTTVQSSSAEVILGNLTVQPGVTSLDLQGAVYSFQDASFADDGKTPPVGATIDGEVMVRGTLGISGVGGDDVGTMTVGNGELELASTATCDAQVSLATVDPLAPEIEADKIIVSSGAELRLDDARVNITGVGRTASDSWANATPTIVDNAAGGDLGKDFTNVTPVPSLIDPPHIGQGAFLRAVTYDEPFPNDIWAVKLDVFVALEGDVDGDGLIGLDDWDSFRANFGSSGADWTKGNFDNFGPAADDTVDLDDWDIFRSRFGENYASPGGGAAAVPEPGAIVMLLGALAGLAVFVRRRR